MYQQQQTSAQSVIFHIQNVRTVFGAQYIITHKCGNRPHSTSGIGPMQWLYFFGYTLGGYSQILLKMVIPTVHSNFIDIHGATL